MAIALVVPPGGDLDIHHTAASLLFTTVMSYSDDGTEGTLITVPDASRRGFRSTAADAERQLMSRRRAVAVVRAVDDIPENFRMTADGIVMLEPPCAAHLMAVAKHVLKVNMTLDQACRLEDESLDRLTAVLRPGREIARSIALVEAMDDARRQRPAGPTLDDLHGLGQAGEWGMELARDIADWRAGIIRWSDVDRGVLVSGPPGTGKTTFAGALARTARMHLLLGSLARWQAKGRLNDLLKAMRDAFDEAKAKAPSILFLDEIDAVGDRERFTGENAQYCSEVVAGLLECLDGAEGREGVVVVGATNRPTVIDAAIRRPGRLDRHVVMPLPDKAARERILRYHLDDALAGEELSAVADATGGWSGAHLERLVRDARRRARRERRPIAVADLISGLPRRVPLPEGDVWRTAVHEAGHVVVAECLRPGSVKEAHIMADFDPSGPLVQDGGGTFQAWSGEHLQTKQTILDRIAISLAGGLAEELVLGDRSTGSGGHPSSDMHVATLDLLRIENSYGLGAGMAYVSDTNDEDGLLAALRSDPQLRRQIESGLREQGTRVLSILGRERDAVEKVAKALCSTKRIGPEQVAELVHGFASD